MDITMFSMAGWMRFNTKDHNHVKNQIGNPNVSASRLWQVNGIAHV
jgi:hypothetical protein